MNFFTCVTKIVQNGLPLLDQCRAFIALRLQIDDLYLFAKLIFPTTLKMPPILCKKYLTGEWLWSIPYKLTAMDFLGMFQRYRLTQGHVAEKANFQNNFTALRVSNLFSNCWGRQENWNLHEMEHGPVRSIHKNEVNSFVHSFVSP